jgi:DNA-binding NarL/FixJ family response regulator
MLQEISPSADTGKKRIFIVDDHPLVREWLATLINQQADLKVCGEAGSAPDAIKLINTAKPHVAIVEISIEGGSGLELIKQIKETHPELPEVQIIVLSRHDEQIYCERALQAGARGYVIKRDATQNVLQAIRSVLDGELFLSRKIALMMAERFLEGTPSVTRSQVDLLSNRELEVFRLLGRGQSTRQIAEQIHVSFKTVQSFCARIKEKLQLVNATALMNEAVRWHDREQEK